MKKYLYSACLLLLVSICTGQTHCIPDSSYADSMPGVYPLPYDAENNPDGGIKQPACLGQDYEFLFTVVVGDSITIPIGPGIKVKLKQIRLDTNDAVDGLPEGITYRCNPPSCTWSSNEIGCVVLEGVVDESNVVDTYSLTIHAEVTTESLGTFDMTFPGSFYPGEYNIEVLDENDPYCASSTIRPKRQPLRVYPNPVISGSDLQITYSSGRIEGWTLFDSRGVQFDDRMLENKESQINSIATEHWSPGIYFLRIQTTESVYTAKLIVIQ